MAASDPQRAAFDRLMEQSKKLTLPEEPLVDVISAAYRLAANPGQKLTEAQASMIAHAVQLYVDKIQKYREIFQTLKELETLLEIRDAEKKMKKEIVDLTLENAELRKLVKPKPDKPTVGD